MADDSNEALSKLRVRLQLLLACPYFTGLLFSLAACRSGAIDFLPCSNRRDLLSETRDHERFVREQRITGGLLDGDARGDLLGRVRGAAPGRQTDDPASAPCYVT